MTGPDHAGASQHGASRASHTTLDEELEKRLRFLREAKADGLPHSELRLLDHLQGTRQLLLAWGARPAVCDAGLFHSVYGTEHFAPQTIPLTMRNTVRHLLGEEAELLAWLFCFMHRESFDQNLELDGPFSVQHRLTGEQIPLNRGQFEDLVTMTFANSLEAFPRCRWNVRRNIRTYLRPFRSRAIPPAQQAFDRIEARWWQLWK